ncbi:hypothetical protein OXX80_000447 [Metschnikowia pulcherrima]
MSSTKKQRTAISCSVCRKRKSKCDRQRPFCGLCRKRSVVHLCSYEDESQVTREELLPTKPEFSTQNGNNMPVFTQKRQVLMAMGAQLGTTTVLGPEMTAAMPFSPSPVPNSYPSMVPASLPEMTWSSAKSRLECFRSPSQDTQQPSPGPHAILPALPSVSMPFVSQPNVEGHSYRGLQEARQPSNPELFSRPGSSYNFQPQDPQQNLISLFPGNTVFDSSSRSSAASTSYLQGQKRRSLSSENSITSAPAASKKPRQSFSSQSTAKIRSYSVPNTGLDNQMSANDSMHYSTASLQNNIPANVSTIISTPMVSSGLGLSQSEVSNMSDVTMASDSSDHSLYSPIKQPQNEAAHDKSRSVSVTIGSNTLKIGIDDTIDAFSNASSTLLVDGMHWQQQGPLSYVGLTKKDQFFRLVRNFTVRLFRSEQFSQFVPKNQKNPAKNCNSTDSKASCEPELEKDILDEDTLVTTKIHHDEDKDNQSNNSVTQYPEILPGLQSLHAIHRSKQEYFRFVEENVASILPREDAVTEAINKYFQYVHPFVPIIHEVTFLEDIEPLFRHKAANSGAKQRVTIENDNQLNLAGQLLLIVRLGYMTLIPNNQVHLRYTKVEQTLIKQITQIKAQHYLSVVHMCISEEKLQTKSTFKLVQSLALLFFYRSVAPNDCLGLSGSDSQLLHGAMVSHALSIGLNRDPLKYDTINSISKEAPFVITWRSLWNYIVKIDAMNSIYSGTALKLPSLDISDTEKPRYQRTSERVAQFSSSVDKVCSCYRRIMRKVANVHSKLKVIDLLMETSKLERIFLEIFGKDFFKEYICGSAPDEVSCSEPERRERNEEAYLKVHRFLLFINTRANLSCLYYLIVIHYEQKLDEDPSAEAQAGIELFKIFIRSVVQIVYIMSYVLDNMHELFGKSYDYILTSRIERSMIKTHTFVSAFFIRLINYKRTLALKEMTGNPLSSSDEEDFETRCEIVDSLFTIVLLEAELFVGHFRTLSRTYINSYKLYVMAFFVLKQCMENPELLLAGITNSKESFFNDGTNLVQFLTNAELQSLCKLCEEFRLAKLESVRRQKEHQNSYERAKQKRNTETNLFSLSNHDFSEARTNGDTGGSESILESDTSSLASVMLDATSANRAMYANEDTVNTYGLLTEKHMHEDYSGEVFDEQNMIGNDELLTLFDKYGLLDG